MLRATSPSMPEEHHRGIASSPSSRRIVSSLPCPAPTHQENPTLLRAARAIQKGARRTHDPRIQQHFRPAATKRGSVAATRCPYRAGPASSRCRCCSAERESPVAVPVNHAYKLSAVAAAHTTRSQITKYD